MSVMKTVRLQWRLRSTVHLIKPYTALHGIVEEMRLTCHGMVLIFSRVDMIGVHVSSHYLVLLVNFWLTMATQPPHSLVVVSKGHLRCCAQPPPLPPLTVSTVEESSHGGGLWSGCVRSGRSSPHRHHHHPPSAQHPCLLWRARSFHAKIYTVNEMTTIGMLS